MFLCHKSDGEKDQSHRERPWHWLIFERQHRWSGDCCAQRKQSRHHERLSARQWTPFASAPATAVPTVMTAVSDEVAVATAPAGGATASLWSSSNDRTATALTESTVRDMGSPMVRNIAAAGRTSRS